MPATVVVGAQWGDEGKGKIVDLLALESDVVCRYQGGPNAGHTIVVGGETFKIRQLPTGIVRGKRGTSVGAIKDDLVNAGMLWEDSPVVVDGNLISSRTPADLPAFMKALIKALGSR